MAPRVSNGALAGTRVTGSGRIAKLALVAVAVASVAPLAAGCSSTEAMYPAVHDMPAARTETTLTPDQVKQATDSLVSEREHLNSEAQTAGGLQPVAATNASATTGSVPPKKSAAPSQPAAQAAGTGVNAYAKQ